ncbi:MAG: tyrosine-type recombinase/integrase [Ignavibacteria bacterium]
MKKDNPALTPSLNIMSEQIKSFLIYLELEKSLSQNTIKSYSFDLKKFVNFLEMMKCSSFNGVNENTVVKFLAYLKKDNKPSTTARILSSLRQFFDYLIDRRTYPKVKTNVFDNFDSPKLPKQLPVVLSVPEIDRIFKQVDTKNNLGLRDRTILETMYASGLRVSELINLKSSNVLAREGIVRVFGKGSKERIVPIGKSALKWINTYLTHSRVHLAHSRSEDFLFLNWRGKKLSRMGVWDIISKYSKLAKIEKKKFIRTF